MKISNFKFQILDVPHYSLREQFELPKILNNLDFDLAHFPHFNAPLFCNGPFVVTIHDLIKHSSRGMTTTTRDPVFYWLKYAGYKIVFGNAVQRAKKIIVPSKAVKEELMRSYNLPEDKVVVIYEGVDEIFKSQISSNKSQIILKKYKIQKPYIIYTGSAYPHKNLERLIEAVKIINHKSLIISLVIVSSRNVFTERLKKFIEKTDSHKFVKFPGFVQDWELSGLYKNAKAFVFPSLTEGFGLPGLEVMAAGCPVVCSDIPVFHEIYGNAATYFNPYDVNDIAKIISEVIRSNDSNHRIVVERGKNRAKQFSWRKMAEQTLQVYGNVLSPQV